MNRVIITNDFEKLLNEIEYDELILRDELKVEDVEEIKRIAYIAEKHKKIIAIAAKKFNIYAQNALLKLLEESPKNVEFVLITDSKYKLLDTILSRLVLEKKTFESEKKEFEIQNITNDLIFNLLQKELEKEEIQAIFKELLKKEVNEEKLKAINDALLMLELNIDKKAVLSYVLLAFKERR
ncbi:DNA polymerase III subunit delta' [Caminibacter sp.]